MNNNFDYRFFADNDYDYFCRSMESGFVFQQMAAQSQEICEKYLKHIIDKYICPETETEEIERESVLHAHSLRNLIKFLKKYNIEIPESILTACLSVDGYYFSAKYPGTESTRINKEDLEECYRSIKTVRNFIDELEKKLKGAE